MPWYVYSLTTALSFTGMVLCVRLLSNRGFPVKLILTFILGFAFVGFTILNLSSISTITQSQNLLPFLLVITFCAVLSVIGNLTEFSAVSIAPNPGFVGAIKSSNVFLTTLLSVWFFASPLGFSKLLGAIIIMTGVVLLVIDRNSSQKGPRVAHKGSFNYQIMAILAAIIFSFVILGQKYTLLLGFSSAQINILVFGLNFITFAFLSRQEFPKLLRQRNELTTLIVVGFIGGAFSLSANYFNVVGVGLAPNPGYNEAIKYSQNFFTTLLAVPLLQASLNRQKIAGVILTFLGVIFVVM